MLGDAVGVIQGRPKSVLGFFDPPTPYYDLQPGYDLDE